MPMPCSVALHGTVFRSDPIMKRHRSETALSGDPGNTQGNTQSILGLRGEVIPKKKRPCFQGLTWSGKPDSNRRRSAWECLAAPRFRGVIFKDSDGWPICPRRIGGDVRPTAATRCCNPGAVTRRLPPLCVCGSSGRFETAHKTHLYLIAAACYRWDKHLPVTIDSSGDYSCSCV